MTLDTLLAFTAYAFVTSVTPGPNNAMLLASGANYGFRPTIPHMLGVNLGFCAMLLAIGLGLGGVIAAFPVLHEVLRYGGAAYLLYLAWRIAAAGPIGGIGPAGGKPFGFGQAAAFQWVNPKAWISAVGAVSIYTTHDGFFFNLLVITLVSSVVNAPCIAAWAWIGTLLRSFLDSPVRLRIFNVAMALLLVASLYPIFFPA
jgi:threonine/homoserine/homoserine lactone efflux protein